MDSNKFQVTKKVRFKLVPCFEESKSEEVCSDIFKDLASLTDMLIDVVNAFFKMVHLSDGQFDILGNDESDCSWKSVFMVKKAWLRTYMRTNFNLKCSNVDSNIFRIINYPFIRYEFDSTWKKQIKGIIINLKELITAQSDSWGKYAQEISILFHRSCFEFFDSFINNLKLTNDLEVNDSIKSLITKSIEIKRLMNSLSKFLFPYYSKGVELYSGSLNYVSLSDTDNNIEQLKESVEKRLSEPIRLVNYPTIEFFRKSIGISQFDNLENVCLKVKKWRNEQKNRFWDALYNHCYEDAKEVELYHDLCVCNLYDRIKFLMDEKSKVDSELKRLDLDITRRAKSMQRQGNIKKQIELFFNGFSRGKSIRWDLLNLEYRKIASLLGRLKSELNEINMIEFKRQQNTHFFFMVKVVSDLYLYAIENNKINTNIFRNLVFAKSNSEPGLSSGLVLESVTFNDLKRISFDKIGNRFVSDMQTEISKCIRDTKDPFSVKKMLRDYKSLNVARKKVVGESFVEFYLAVLKYYAKQKMMNIDLEGIDGLSFDTIEDFENEIDRRCYTIRFLPFDDSFEKCLMEDCKAVKFKILYNYNQANQKILADVWKKDSIDLIRLMPNLKVYYREALDNKKGFEETRFSKNQYSMECTYIENPNSPKFVYDGKSLEKMVSRFNQRFNHPKFDVSLHSENDGDFIINLSSIITNDSAHQIEVWIVRPQYLDYEKTYFCKGVKKVMRLVDNLCAFVDFGLYSKLFLTDNDVFSEFDKRNVFVEEFNKLFVRKMVSSVNVNQTLIFDGKVIVVSQLSKARQMTNMKSFVNHIADLLIRIYQECERMYDSYGQISLTGISDNPLTQEGYYDQLEYVLYSKLQNRCLVPVLNKVAKDYLLSVDCIDRLGVIIYNAK
ncbi:MAG: hypothetical protein MJZ66_02300 [Bacteroidales bacterium]|nr:hypothetical protein [Bacteroidales bacterium]